ncbi:MAG: glycosyltransferase family 2 protein [Bacteroidales bacterium]|nr:glycosyltransferase family 2 protein [Bacteroidales bacterium]
MPISPLNTSPRTCVLIPTYNHAPTLRAVVEDALRVCPHVIVVDDGSTDSTAQVLQQLVGNHRVEVVAHQPNRGKGYALRAGLNRAWTLGFEHVVTMDSDGQHLAADIGKLLTASQQHPHALIVGSRSLSHKHMPQGNRIANRLSNFWFAVQTGHRLPDTQTGFRLYPLECMCRLRPLFNRYEAELELLVRAAWRGVELVPVGINVVYPPKGERVSHFKPTIDFVRISLLNTALCVLAVLYGYPRMGIQHLVSRWHHKTEGGITAPPC